MGVKRKPEANDPDPAVAPPARRTRQEHGEEQNGTDDTRSQFPGEFSSAGGRQDGASADVSGVSALSSALPQATGTTEERRASSVRRGSRLSLRGAAIAARRERRRHENEQERNERNPLGDGEMEGGQDRTEVEGEQGGNEEKEDQPAAGSGSLVFGLSSQADRDEEYARQLQEQLWGEDEAEGGSLREEGGPGGRSQPAGARAGGTDEERRLQGRAGRYQSTRGVSGDSSESFVSAPAAAAAASSRGATGGRGRRARARGRGRGRGTRSNSRSARAHGREIDGEGNDDERRMGVGEGEGEGGAASASAGPRSGRGQLRRSDRLRENVPSRRRGRRSQRQQSVAANDEGRSGEEEEEEGERSGHEDEGGNLNSNRAGERGESPEVPPSPSQQQEEGRRRSSRLASLEAMRRQAASARVRGRGGEEGEEGTGSSSSSASSEEDESSPAESSSSEYTESSQASSSDSSYSGSESLAEEDEEEEDEEEEEEKEEEEEDDAAAPSAGRQGSRRGSRRQEGGRQGQTNDLPCNHRLNQDGSYEYDEEAARTDPITFEDLEPVHVDFFSPDGSFHACFNTSTLLEMARRKGYFAQPPAFYERVSPGTVAGRNWLNEIASKLERQGRGGRPVAEQVRRGEVPQGGGGQGAPVPAQLPTSYLRLVYRHMRGHILLCPLCYEALKAHMGSRGSGRGTDGDGGSSSEDGDGGSSSEEGEGEEGEKEEGPMELLFDPEVLPHVRSFAFTEKEGVQNPLLGRGTN
uniref:Uncharacterized protein n=1 Tax=Chromera velia CCMP2878 TaxID=1169474 RepID=A0A0G4GR13_9ALVE|eukprot:Cvel_5068.t1-p1 / transcript=Cvel_5068.t1 / gene=Cvel_5068 / organism=Chromera_velia_CCMP2878 / gene_product=hypothetical protein / transcript_product=hypothetical protein / location=Cvel_scaffold231:29499-33126(+) / protein_length=752 / sequence_SO=supercontig / SO=protein_coding / is_pseudo=false